MTKEELEKEAEESSKKAFCIAHTHEDELIYMNGYLAGAEPREKQIQIDAEQIRALQKQNGELTDELKALRESMKDYGAGCYENGLRNGRRKVVEQMAKLSKENAELKQAKEGKIVEHFEAYGQCRDSRRIADLEAQIEKMRNCANCKNYNDNECFCVLGSGYGYNCNLEKWEIKEK